MGLKFFPSRYPIMCAVMNQVSNLALALAVQEAGCMPSLQIDRYNQDKTINHDKVHAELGEFVLSAGNSNLVLVAAEEDLFDYAFIKAVRQHRISHLEILGNEVNTTAHWLDPRMNLAIQYVKQTTKILTRAINTPSTNPYADGICIKGKESAGFAGSVSVCDLFEQQKAISTQAVIPYGGIGTPQQVKHYLEKGAAGVAVGTLFAATQESCLSTSTKLSMCNSSASDLVTFQETGQNALVLGNKESVLTDSQDWNRSASLATGIAGRGGHIYAGAGIDHVTEIKTVKQVVDYLVQHIV